MAKRKSTATYEDGDEPNRCRARSKSTGGRCKQPKVPGREVCRFHGGHAGAPIKHGRWSEALGRFREAYDAALENRVELMDLGRTLAVLDVAVQRSAERLAERDTPAFRRMAWAKFEEVRAAREPGEQVARLSELGRMLRDGVQEDAAFDDLTRAAERLAKRQERAWGIELHAAQVVNAREVATIMARLVDVVVEELSGDDASRVIARIDREVMAGGARQAGAR